MIQHSSPDPASAPRQLLAVVYAFETYQDGQRRFVPQEELPASTLAMIEPQLAAVPKRTMLDYGSGLLVYDNYQDARYAAAALAQVAPYVALREVAPGAPDSGESWLATSGARYAPVEGGLSEVVKV